MWCHHKLRWISWIMLLVFQLFVTSECGIGCLDNRGNPVDWFIVIKLPHLPGSNVSTVQKGVGQLYLDTNNKQWTLLDYGIDAVGHHAVYNTLQQIYSQHSSQDMMYMLYNDEVPGNRTSLKYGHTKGDVCFDKSSGFWLVHSVPKFPPAAKQGYSYPNSGKVYGQSLLCVTFRYQQLNKIGKQLLYNYPQIYDYSFPSSFAEANPNITSIIKRQPVQAEPWYNVLSLPSMAGQIFISFAKFTKYGADLYDAMVAPYLKSGLSVETWMNGPNPMPSNCSAHYQVMNVLKLKLLTFSFGDHQDHSKWAVSDDNNWICIGDINREESQKKRAGGTVCSQLRGVPNVFSNGISCTEKCGLKQSNIIFNSWRFNQL